MVDVRAKNTGTFDHSTKTWRIKGRGIQISVRQLSKRYGVEIEPSERASAPYWRRYLQDIEDRHRQAKKASSPLQGRIATLEALMVRLKAEGRPTDEVERHLNEAISVPGHDIDHADIIAVHPDAEDVAKRIGVETDEYALALLHNLIPPPPPKPTIKDSIVHEATIFIDRYKARGNKYWFQVKQIMNLFTEVTGDISIHEVTVHHYRQAREKIIAYPTWNDTSKAKHLQTLNTFLKRVEVDHGVNYHFIRNPDYRLTMPEGRKEQYTLEQVKIALQHATGDIRFALLLGLNAGVYWSDIKRLTPDMVEGNYLRYIRKKNQHKPNPLRGCYLLWNETKQMMQYGVNTRKLLEQYTAFARQHGLPGHKALRKTTAQMIQDKVKDEIAARLYRAEKVSGNHGKNYIVDFTPDQIRILDKALRKVAKMYGVN